MSVEKPRDYQICLARLSVLHILEQQKLEKKYSADDTLIVGMMASGYGFPKLGVCD